MESNIMADIREITRIRILPSRSSLPTTVISALVNEEGDKLTNPEDIIEILARYYAKLYSEGDKSNAEQLAYLNERTPQTF